MLPKLMCLYDPYIIQNFKWVFKHLLLGVCCLVIYFVSIPSAVLVDAILGDLDWPKYKHAYKTIHVELHQCIFTDL